MAIETSSLIREASATYDEYDMDALPSELQPASLDHYYLSVYPGLNQAPELSPDQLPVMPDTMTSAYVHTPYCTGVCDFCSYFLTTVDPEDRSPVAGYLELVKKEITTASRETDLDLSYVYFGGGTPSLIPNPALERFFEFLSAENALADSRFGTIELHPEFFKDYGQAQGFIDILKANGINRVSVGFQSSDEDILADTSRRHDAGFLSEAISFLRHNGMMFNLDLMYGLPDMSLRQWQQTLEDATAHQPDSVSTYFMFVSPRTITRHKIETGQVQLPTSREIQIQHIMAQQFLERLGYHELPSDFYAKLEPGTDPSTFAQGSLPSDGASLAFGAGAYGYYDSTQYFNHFNLADYSKRVSAGKSAIWSGHRFEGDDMVYRDVMFSLKNSPHLDRPLFEARYGFDIAKRFAGTFGMLATHGLVEINDGSQRISLTPKGRLCVEQICCQFESPALRGASVEVATPAERRTREKHHFFATYGSVAGATA